MKLIITIDTEEDNWEDYNSTGSTVSNTSKIPLLQELFDEFDVKPTYLITYPVASDEKAVSILKGIMEENRCEIGAHCHPWNTPPFEEETNGKNSMLCNLPSELQYRKMSFLHNTIMKNFGIEPVSFRSGRWGYGRNVAGNLQKLGYSIDTSIIAFTDWTDSHGPDFSDIPPEPFRFSIEDIYRESSNGRIIEIPATVGFLQQNFTLNNNILKMISRKPVSLLRLVGILSRLNLLNKVWLSPEVSDSKRMIKLTKCMMKNNYKFINMFFHTTSLKTGITPFVKTSDEEREFLRRIREYFVFLRDAGIESIKLSEAEKYIL